MRVDAGFDSHAPDAELSWAARTVYSVAPTLPEPHGTALLRLMTHNYDETATPIPPLKPEVR